MCVFRNPKPQNEIDFAQFLYAYLDVETREPNITKTELLVEDSDLTSIENTKYNFLDEEVFLKKVNFASGRSVAVIGGSKINKKSVDEDLEAIIGRNLINDYVQHISPLTHYGQIILCAPLLYSFAPESGNKRLGGGGCLFLLNNDKELNERLLRELYLLSFKICSLVLVTLDVASVSVRQETKVVESRFIQAVQHSNLSSADKESLQEKVAEIVEDRLANIFSKKVIRKSASDIQLFEELKEFAKTDIPILITGATGVGKEFISREIAEMSSRDDDLIRTINCATFANESLLMSELFGHVKGAFTGADRHRLGLILEASGYISDGTQGGQGKGGSQGTKPYQKWLKDKNGQELGNPIRAYNGEWCYSFPSGNVGGTLILDEVAELTSPAQAALLRVLDGLPFKPVGYEGPGFLPNVRVISITNDEEKLRTEFRKDLLARIEGCHVIIDSLEKRQETVEEVIIETINKMSFRESDGTTNQHHFTIDNSTLKHILKDLSEFKGGMRELIWMVQRACVYARMQGSAILQMEHLVKAQKRGFLWNAPLISKDGTGVNENEKVKALREKIIQTFRDAETTLNAYWDYNEFKNKVKELKKGNLEKAKKIDCITKIQHSLDGCSTEIYNDVFNYNDTAKAKGTIEKFIKRKVQEIK